MATIRKELTLSASPAQVRDVIREEDAHRLVWSVIGGRATHHNSSFQVFPRVRGG